MVRFIKPNPDPYRQIQAGFLALKKMENMMHIASGKRSPVLYAISKQNLFLIPTVFINSYQYHDPKSKI